MTSSEYNARMKRSSIHTDASFTQVCPDVLPLGSSLTARSVAVCVGDTCVHIRSGVVFALRGHTLPSRTMFHAARIYPVAVCGVKVIAHA